VISLDEFQRQRAIIALRKVESQKDIKRYKLAEHLQNVRLSLLLRLPYSVVKAHNNCHMSVSSVNGMVRMSFPDDYIPIRRYLSRSDSPTFEKWLQTFHPDKFEEYQRDKMRFLFGSNTALVFTDECQRLMDEYDCDCWVASEEMRRYYFSSLLADCDISSMDEFLLFGSVNPPHSQAEIDVFKAELTEMQTEYLKHPDRFFHPSADADSTGAVPPAVV
jgi:hypothetical protein